MNNASRVGQGEDGETRFQPHNNREVSNLEKSAVSTVNTVMSSTYVPDVFATQKPHSIAEYYALHVADLLKPNTIRIYHSRSDQICCCCRYAVASKAMARKKTYGFLSDLVDSDIPNLRTAALLFQQLFNYCAEHQINIWLNQLHHLNLLVYNAKHIDDVVVMNAVSRMRAHLAYFKDQSNTKGITGGILGGHGNGTRGGKRSSKPSQDGAAPKGAKSDEEGKPRKKESARKGKGPKPQKEMKLTEKEEKQLEANPSIRNSQGALVADQPKPDADRTIPVALPDDRLSPPRAPHSEKKVDRKPRAGSKPAKNAWSKGPPRQHKNNSAISRSLNEDKAKAAGEMDALNDKIEELKEDLAEAKAEVEIEIDIPKDMDLTSFLNGNVDHHENKIAPTKQNTTDDFSVRPACNVGIRIEPLMLGGRNVTLPILFIFLAATVFLLFLWSMWLLLICEYYTSLWALIAIVPLLIVHIAIGYKGVMYYYVMIKWLLEGRAEYMKIHSRAEFLNNLRTVGCIENSGGVLDLRPSDIKIGKAHLTQVVNDVILTGPIRAVVADPNVLNFNEPVAIMETQRLYKFFNVANVEGGICVVNKSGSIDQVRTAILGVFALFLGGPHTTLITGSHTAKEFAKPASERGKPDNFAYVARSSILPYDVHTFHNTSTYSANSSQVSEETNFAIIYRKISRYTEINISRFGVKDLQTNAEVLCRMQYFAIREAHPNFLARQHF